MTSAPRVSVIMAVHNEERFLAEAVESVLAQSFGDFELLISDDGSTDRTPSSPALWQSAIRSASECFAANGIRASRSR